MMEQYLSDKVKAIKPSGIRKFFDLASAMDDVISLGVEGNLILIRHGTFVKPPFIRLRAAKRFILPIRG